MNSDQYFNITGKNGPLKLLVPAFVKYVIIPPMHTGKILLQRTDLIISDFDGTITLRDTGLAMIDTLSPPEASRAWEAEFAWRRGEISSMDCLRQQWSLFKKSRQEIAAFLDKIALDENFFVLLKLARQRQAGVAILSDGLDFYVHHSLARYGIIARPDDACVRSSECLTSYANVASLGPHGLQISFPYANDCGLCGNCKTEHLLRLRHDFARVIYIGDGHSDLCAARYAEIIFAKNALAEDCQRTGRIYIPFESFADILRVLE